MASRRIPDDEESPSPDPQMLSGSRAVSLAGALELIEAQFNAETRPDMLLHADEHARRQMIREVTDFVLASEGIKLSRADRLAVIETLYGELFNLGPLEPYVNDPEVTEIQIAAYDRVYVRYGMADRRIVDARFGDPAHLERVVSRALAQAGITLGEPFIEIGVMLAGRPVRLTITGVPISPALHVDLRLHPAQPLTLRDLIEDGVMNEDAASLLEAIIEARHGLMIVGEADSGKTTLLQALLPLIAAQGTSFSVERAAELRAPTGIRQLCSSAEASFAQQIWAALTQGSDWLVLDEVRFDESAEMWQALAATSGPRCLWVFRGATDPLRLRTAFGMAVRRAAPGIAQETIHSALVDRLSFVAMMGRRERQIRLLRVCEWQPEASLEHIALGQLWPPEGSVRPLKPLRWG